MTSNSLVERAKNFGQYYLQLTVPIYYAYKHFMAAGNGLQFPAKADTDICVEAYQSSANSFLYILLHRYIAPGKSFAHHTHALASLKEAERLKVPTVFIIRNPHEAISSRLTRFGGSVTPCVLHYISLYQFVLESEFPFLVIDFEEIKSDLMGITEKLSNYLGSDSSFSLKEVEKMKQEIFDEIDEHYEEFSTVEKSASPNVDRAEQKAQAAALVTNHPQFTKAEHLYNELYKKSTYLNPEELGRKFRQATSDHGRLLLDKE